MEQRRVQGILAGFGLAPVACAELSWRIHGVGCQELLGTGPLACIILDPTENYHTANLLPSATDFTSHSQLALRFNKSQILLLCTIARKLVGP